MDTDHRTGGVVLRCDRHHTEYVVLLGTEAFSRDVIQSFETHDGYAETALAPVAGSS